MLAQVHSFVLQGIDPLPCEVEVDVAEQGLIKTTVVGTKRPDWARFVAFVFVIAASVTGCSPFEPVTWYTSSPEDRQASFEHFEHLEVNGIPLRKHVANYTCIIYVNAVIDPARWQRQSPWANLKPIDESQPVHGGLAVPLTTDGYFLTTAHVVRSEGMQLLVPDDEQSLVEARLVWRSRNWPEEQRHINPEADTDLAVIHANIEWDHVPLWAKVHSLQWGTPVAIGTADPATPIGGHFLQIFEDQVETPTVQMKWFAYTAPSIRGNSGGPVMLTNGQLIGIHTGSTSEATWFRRHIFFERTKEVPASVGVAPDPNALMKIIEDDRERQHNAVGLNRYQ